MTICKTLATATKNGYTITAYKVYEKFTKVPHYEIITSKDGIGLWVDRTARTTWKKKFKQTESNMHLW